jgi:shikimate kinase
MNDLEKYREQLGFCDDKIIDALVERNSIIEKMKNSKRIQARKLFDYNIVLIGFMGAGKSSVSEYLSAVFAMKVVEMDQVIANREQMSIPDIFDAYGEEYFRDRETELLVEMQSHRNTVISCGGGAALRERNVEEMKKNGRVVLLTASPETVYERVKDNDDRPVLNGRKNVKGISELMEQRREKYEAAADIVINTDNKTVLQVCEELVQRLMEMED